MYEVRWAHEALGDLRVKVVSPSVRRYLWTVAQTALDRHPGRWGGCVGDLWWRRGVLPDDETDPDAIRGCVLPDGRHEMPYDFVFVHLRPMAQRRASGYLVLGLLTNPEVLAGLGPDAFGDGRIARWSPPPRPPRRPGLTRHRGGGGSPR